MDYRRLSKILIIIIGFFVLVNLVFLDAVYFTKPKEEMVKPMIGRNESKKEASETPIASAMSKVTEVSKGNCEQSCLNIINEAIATLSGKPQETVKTVYQQAPSVKQPGVIYIPLGGGMSTTNGFWSYVGGAEGYFNKKDYPGAKKISWEAFFKINGAGEANARLYDATHQVVISDSEIRGGTSILVLKSSPALNFLDGNNLYQVELRSSTSNEVYMEGARIKVEY